MSIIKMSAHCTDLLQPLNVSCFAPLKSFHEKELTKYVQETGAREALKKGEFCNMISRIWYQDLTVENVKSGFKAAGIFPVEKTKYKVE